MMFRLSVIIMLLACRLLCGAEEVKLPFTTFSAGYKYGEVLPKTMIITLDKAGTYRVSAEIHSPVNLFSAAQIEVYQTLICAQGRKTRIRSNPQGVNVVFENKKPGKQKFIIKMISYTGGQNLYWKNIKLEYLGSKATDPSLFDLWRNFKSPVPKDKEFTAYKISDPCCTEEKLPPSPTIAGDIVIGRPTQNSIGLRWQIKQDYNRNGQVKTAYRKKGDSKWIPAQDMFRMMFERTGFSRLSWSYVCPNQYAGSILELMPATEYEIKLSLFDPDGGSCEKIITTATRDVLRPAKDDNIIAVYPGTLKKAYLKAKPGDILLLHPGIYSFKSIHNAERYKGTRKYIFPPVLDEDRSIYEDFSKAVKDSAVTFSKKALPGKPITIRGKDKDKVIIDGGTSGVLFNFTNAEYHRFENMTLQNAEYVFFSNNAKGISISDCIIRDCRYGIVAGSGDLKKLYSQSAESTAKMYDVDIFNNQIIGNWPLDQWDQGWTRYTKEIGYQKLRFSSGIMLGGQGHSVYNNHITQFWDGFGIYFIVKPQKDFAYHSSCIDLYNNYIGSCPDDCIETDFGVNNIRVYRNFVSNSHMGISCQPVCGGPAYIYKNIIFNSRMFAFKFSRNPSGVLIYNNTCIVARGGRFAPEWQNSRIMNNLFIGNSDITTGPLWTGNPTPATSVLDYNGYNNCGTGKVFWCYAGPGTVVMAKGYTIFDNLKKFSQKTGWEKNGVFNVKTGEFQNYVKPDYKYVNDNTLDVRPVSNASFAEAGKLIYNINSDYTGSSPCIGAYDSGQKRFQYGPQ